MAKHPRAATEEVVQTAKRPRRNRSEVWARWDQQQPTEDELPPDRYQNDWDLKTPTFTARRRGNGSSIPSRRAFVKEGLAHSMTSGHCEARTDTHEWMTKSPLPGCLPVFVTRTLPCCVALRDCSADGAEMGYGGKLRPRAWPLVVLSGKLGSQEVT